MIHLRWSYILTYSLAFCYGKWRGASSVEQRGAALAEALQKATEKPGLLKFLPGWIMDFLQTCDSRPASPRHASLLPATVPIKAPFEDPFVESRLAFEGPLSLRKASRQHGRRRKARIPARAPVLRPH